MAETVAKDWPLVLRMCSQACAVRVEVRVVGGGPCPWSGQTRSVVGVDVVCGQGRHGYSDWILRTRDLEEPEPASRVVTLLQV